MIKGATKETTGILTFISFQMVLREFWKKWIELGLIKGFIKMFREGIPLFAWTQSKRVVGAMLELSNLWLPLEGEKVPEKAKEIVKYYSRKHKRPVDENLIARNVYRGRIALREKERFRFRRKGLEGWWERIFPPNRYRKIDKLFDQLGERDAVPVIGYFTLWVALKMSRYLKIRAWRDR